MSEDSPEITCGSAAMAICSVGFMRDKTTLALVVKRIENTLVVTGEY